LKNLLLQYKPFRWLRTVSYIGLGCIIIHLLNVIRIALLAMALYAYPQYEHLLHGVVFPLFIYSVVFVLWVLWVQKFSGHADKHPKQ
jgi:exosortase family protein XrtF